MTKFSPFPKMLDKPPDGAGIGAGVGAGLLANSFLRASATKGLRFLMILIVKD